jgi:serine/threonine-protein kinase HipA
MSVRRKNKHYLIKDIQRRHFNAMAVRCGIGETAEPLIQKLLASTPSVVDRVQRTLPDAFPQQTLEKVLKGLAQSARQLEEMPAM